MPHTDCEPCRLIRDGLEAEMDAIRDAEDTRDVFDRDGVGAVLWIVGVLFFVLGMAVVVVAAIW